MRPVLTALTLVGLLAATPGQALSVPRRGEAASLAASQSGATAVSVQDGLRITVGVDRRSYPRNAIVRVSVAARNISHSNRYIPFACSGPPNPNIQVLNARGRVVFPPDIPVAPPPEPPVMGCKSPLPRRLAPGQAVRWTDQFAVLRGARIRVGVGVGSARDLTATGFFITTLHIALKAADPPAVAYSETGMVRVSLTPRGPVSGSPRLRDWWLCPGDVPANGANQRWYRPVDPSNIVTSCNRPTAWHGVVGWLDHSVARIDYPPRPAAQTSRSMSSISSSRR